MLRRQDDWADIYDNIAIQSDSRLRHIVGGHSEKDYVFKSRDALSESSKSKLAYVWFKSARHSSQIKYPQSESEFSNYKIYQSSKWEWLVFSATLIQIIGPFFASPFCGYSTDYHIISTTHDDAFSSPTAGIPIGMLSGLYMLLSVFQITDLYMWCKSTSWEFVFNDKFRMVAETGHVWAFLRFFSAAAIFWDCFLYFFLGTTPRITRCLSPVLYISRRENLKAIVEGFVTSFHEALPVFRMLVLVLAMWAFVGFYMFQRIDDSSRQIHFSTYTFSLMTCLHCFSSRPTVLYRILQLWENSNVSALYFVILTVFADLIVGAFLVAVGNRYYRDFTMFNFRKRLMYRRKALLALFYLYCDIDSTSAGVSPAVEGADEDATADDVGVRDTGEARKQVASLASANDKELLSLENWLLFCGHVTKCNEDKKTMFRKQMKLIFLREDSQVKEMNNYSTFECTRVL